jgi:hypothetical protein
MVNLHCKNLEPPMSQSGHFLPEILKAATRLAAGFASKLTQIQPVGVSHLAAEKCHERS